MNPFDLNGKTALVTGGNQGLGKAFALGLAQAGARVAICGRRQEANLSAVAEAKTAGFDLVPITADITDDSQISAMTDQAMSAFDGRIDILVNNAGIAVMAPLDQFPLDDYDRLMAVNVRGVFVASQEAARHMKEGGRIITIGSTNAERMPFAGGGVYAASKAAVAGLTKGLARDLGPRGITVNNVQPGPVDTELNPKDGPFAESLKSLMALPRYGTGDEIASFVAYLAGPESAYITGASLLIDGGFAA